MLLPAQGRRRPRNLSERYVIRTTEDPAVVLSWAELFNRRCGGAHPGGGDGCSRPAQGQDHPVGAMMAARPQGWRGGTGAGDDNMGSPKCRIVGKSQSVCMYDQSHDLHPHP
jgi:hypothetical protein